jgi:hypothetical protein
MALAPGKDLDRHRRAPQPHRELRARAAQARLAGAHVAERREREHRRHQVRPAAVVLLGRVGRVAVVLVGRDRLVLHTVVRGQIAAAERHQRRGEADERDRGLAPRRRSAPSRQADGVAPERRGAHGAERPEVLHRQTRLGQGALDERDDGHRLGELDHAANARNALGGARAQLGLGSRGDLDATVARADGGGPMSRAMHEQAVAERHAAQAKLVLGDWSGHRTKASRAKTKPAKDAGPNAC